jgi:hypothetical protein
MPDAYGHSLYSELIDEIVADSSLDAELANLGDDQFKVWILRAEERICSSVNVMDEWSMQLLSGYDTYQITENPAITGATAASPIVLTTKSAHGLTAGTMIRIARVNGINANGQFVVAAPVTTNSFAINYLSIVGGALNQAPIVINTTQPHGFSTGDTVTIANVLGNTAANGTWTITLVDQANFSLNGSTGNGTYTGGGTATKVSSGVGQTYVGGGRFWTLQQLPSHFRDVKTIRALINNFIQEIEISDFRFLTHLESEDNIFLLGEAATYIYPVQVMINSKDTQDYMRFYPAPVVQMEARCFGSIRINPNLYIDDPVQNGIHLPKQYDDAIRIFVRSRIYSYLKDREEELRHLQLFKQSIAEEKANKSPHTKMRIRYT